MGFNRDIVDSNGRRIDRETKHKTKGTKMKKQNLYKTALHVTSGQYVSVIRAFENGDGTWRYSVKFIDGHVEAQLDEKHFDRFCL